MKGAGAESVCGAKRGKFLREPWEVGCDLVYRLPLSTANKYAGRGSSMCVAIVFRAA